MNSENSMLNYFIRYRETILMSLMVKPKPITATSELFIRMIQSKADKAFNARLKARGNHGK